MRYKLRSSSSSKSDPPVAAAAAEPQTTDLTDAGLGLIKRKILEKTNRALGKPLLQTVVFSDFSFVEQ